PSGPALRVEPRVRSRPRPEWHDRRFVLTAPCAEIGGGWRRMLVKPFGDAMRGGAARGVLDDAFEGLPQHCGVGGVWLVFQRPQDAAADYGYVCVTAPTSDGKPIRYLDEKPGVLCGIVIGGVAHR